MLGFPLSEFYTLIIGDNIYHSENASSNRDHSAETVELRYDFKLLRTTVSIPFLNTYG